MTRRLRPLALRTLKAGNRPGPANRRPKVLRRRTILAAAILAVGLTGCVVPPTVVDMTTDAPPQIGTAISIVSLECVTPDGFPFRWVGPTEGVPDADCEVAG